jgi:hypothetical protein
MTGRRSTGLRRKLLNRRSRLSQSSGGVMGSSGSLLFVPCCDPTCCLHDECDWVAKLFASENHEDSRRPKPASDPSPIGAGLGSRSDPSPIGAGLGSRSDPSPIGAGLGSRSDPSPIGAGLGSRSDPSPIGAGLGSRSPQGAGLAARRCVLGSRRCCFWVKTGSVGSIQHVVCGLDAVVKCRWTQFV